MQKTITICSNQTLRTNPGSKCIFFSENSFWKKSFGSKFESPTIDLKSLCSLLFEGVQWRLWFRIFLGVVFTRQEKSKTFNLKSCVTRLDTRNQPSLEGFGNIIAISSDQLSLAILLGMKPTQFLDEMEVILWSSMSRIPFIELLHGLVIFL